jgi:hypothetical protein
MVNFYIRGIWGETKVATTSIKQRQFSSLCIFPFTINTLSVHRLADFCGVLSHVLIQATELFMEVIFISVATT